MGGARSGAWNLKQLRCFLFSLLVLHPRRAVERKVVASFHVNPTIGREVCSEDKAYREVQLGDLTENILLTKPPATLKKPSSAKMDNCEYIKLKLRKGTNGESFVEDSPMSMEL